MIRGRWCLLGLGLAGLLVGCAGRTYWAFPPGTTAAEFRVHEARCQANPPLFRACLLAAGYVEISSEEFVRRQQRVLETSRRGVDIVGYELDSGRLLIGKSQPQPGARTGAVEVASADGDLTCTGYAELTKRVPGAKGSLGAGELLCKDGRKIMVECVYESPTSGYGRGIDDAKRGYRFIFGQLNLDHEKLRAQFRDMLQNEQRAPVVKPAERQS